MHKMDGFQWRRDITDREVYRYGVVVRDQSFDVSWTRVVTKQVLGCPPGPIPSTTPKT